MAKVLIIGPAYPLRGGLATYNERLCKAFNDDGHKTSILSFKLQYPEFLFPGTTQYSSDEPPKDIKIYTEINSINPFNWLKVGYQFKKEQYDLVIFRYWMPFMGPALGTIARILKQNKKTKVIAICDNLIPHEKRVGDKQFTQYFVSALDGLLTMSRSVYDDISTYFPLKKKTYLPHPMYDSFGPIMPREQALTSLNLDSNTRYILFFGFIRKYKGLDTLIRTMAHPKISELPVKAIIAGEFYEDSKPYFELIEELNISNKLILKTDFIPNSEVSKYFSAADMVVQPYHSATQSGVTQIAYYYGIPMLVTNVGGLAELVPHNEVGYVCSQDIENITESIVDFYTNNRFESMSEQVKIQSKKFSWSMMVETLIALSNGTE